MPDKLCKKYNCDHAEWVIVKLIVNFVIRLHELRFLANQDALVDILRDIECVLAVLGKQGFLLSYHEVRFKTSDGSRSRRSENGIPARE